MDELINNGTTTQSMDLTPLIKVLKTSIDLNRNNVIINVAKDLFCNYDFRNFNKPAKIVAKEAIQRATDFCDVCEAYGLISE